MANTMVRTCTIEDLIAELRRLPSDSLGLAERAVSDLLAGVQLDPESIAPYELFAPGCYTRNLIFKDDLFEVLALCWDVGQVSSIHNHRDQRCWMLVPRGQLECQGYRVLDRDPAARTCRLVESQRSLITPELPAAVEEDEPVHQIRNLRAWGTRATSIHVYSRPFDTCEVYSLERGVYGDIKLSYWSTHGKLCRDRTAPGAS